MIALSHKSKHYGLIALKLLILSLTFGYVYQKLNSGTGLNFQEFILNILYHDSHRWPYWILFIALAGTNWALEILKWQTVVSRIQKISFIKAAKESLAALTVSLATPNRIGDYGAKALFYPRSEQKKIILVNFFSNSVQMAVTFVFGIIGSFLITQHFQKNIPIKNTLLFGIIILLLIGLAVRFRKKELLIKGLSIVNIMKFFKGIATNVKWKITLFSIVRYGVFSCLFFLLLNYFNAQITFLEALPIIFVMYLLVSVIPSFFVLDVVIRGGIALWLFSEVGVSELSILSTVLAMWLLNFVLPAIWGSFYVITFKPS